MRSTQIGRERMIKVYNLTPSGKAFLKKKPLGFTQTELHSALKLLLEEGKNGAFPFDTERDKLLRQHVSILSHSKYIERDKSLEEEIQESLKKMV